MTKHSNPRPAQRGTTAFVAGEHLYKHGPMTERELFTAIDFGSKATVKADALQRSLRSGWLTEQQDGKIAISLYARVFYDRMAGIEPVKHVGQVAAPRQHTDVFTRPALSKKHIPNVRGTRVDIPAWSMRSGTFFHTKA